MTDVRCNRPYERGRSLVRSSSWGALSSAGCTLLALCAGAWLATEMMSSPASLQASTALRFSRSTPTDLDADGLADALELRLGTDADQADTDGDGYSDAEEIARGSSPLHIGSIPGLDPLGLSLVAYQHGGPVQLTSVIYAQDGDLASKSLSMGVRVGSMVRPLPLAFFTQGASIVNFPGATPGSVLMVIDSAVDPLLVMRFGSLSFFATLSNQGKIAEADVVDLLWKDGLVLEYVMNYLATEMPVPSQQTPPSSGKGQYEPLDPEAIPPDWTPDQICSQTMMLSASIGPVIIQEVVSAECAEGWDAYCDPGCPATVGTTIETLDPGALIGG